MDKKAIVISDSHGYLVNARAALTKYEDIETVIHLGDLVADAEALKKEYPNKKFIYIAGNNDYVQGVPGHQMFYFGGHKILITHGHKERVSYGLLKLSFFAQEKDAEVVLFGHTHLPLAENHMGIDFFNPGSISLPRGGHKPSYGIISALESGVIEFKIHEI